jgi:hypothetical protein
MEFTQPMRGTIDRRRPKSTAKRRARKKAALFILGLAFILVLPLFFSVGAYGYLEAFEIILPGVEIGGVPVEGLAIPEAAAKISQIWNEDYRILAVDTTDPGRTWIVEPEEFGLWVDANASASQAYAVGRGAGLAAGVQQMYADDWKGEPKVAFDPGIARAALEAWAAKINIAPVEGHLEISDGHVSSAPGKAGKALDVEASLALIAADPAGVFLTYRFIPLVMVPVEPMITDVSAAATKAERLLASAPTLRAYDPVEDESYTWQPTREEIASWLEIQRGEHEFVVELDADRIRAHISGWNTSLGDERFFDEENALERVMTCLEGGQSEALQIHYRPRTYVVERPQTVVSLGARLGMPFWKLVEANPQLAGRDPYVGETLTLPPKDGNLMLPVVMNKRIVISISEQHMWVYQDGELIADHVVSTGIAKSPTMAGIFQVQSHFEDAYASTWDLWMPHFLGIYEAVPGFENGIHGLPMLSNGVRLWGSVLGQPASYGCIILTLEAAEELYNWAEDGVVVEIRR